MMTENDTLMEIVHLASAALVADLSEVKRQALADIYDAIASLLPVEKVSHGGTETRSGRDGCPQPSADPQGLSKFLTVVPGVTLVRFAGNDEIKLVARRVGSLVNPNTIFEINVDKAAKEASVWRDGRLLFEMQGVSVGYSMIEKCAVSALHRWFKNQRKHNSKRRRAAKLREGILTPEQELARTVAEQKEGL